MARLKRSSLVLEQANRRLAGMRSINESLNFGDGLSLTEYDARIQALQTQISSYNTMLSGVDEMTGQIALLEKELRSYSERMLMSVAVHYGKNSLQYVQAGGKQRKSVRRSTGNATTPAPIATVETVTAPSTEKVQMNGGGTKTAL